MYLTDQDLIKAMMNCRNALTYDETTGKGGVVFVKENIKSHGAWFDREDNSLIRNPLYFESIFKTCGFEILHKSTQQGWPKDLFAL